MATINQLASRIANTLNQPDNIELIERSKDIIRGAYATKIKDMISKDGIKNSLLTHFVTTATRSDYNEFMFNGNVKASTTSPYLITPTKIVRPIDIRNDAPFQSIRTSQYNIPYNPVHIEINVGLLSATPPVAFPITYAIENEHLIIRDNGKRLTNSDLIFITGVLEQAELVLARNNDPDNVDLPIPNSIIEDMLYLIYKIDFNMYPKNIEINVNKDQITNN